MKNNQPLVSVIMNCYNSDTYLKEAINSVISQTYTNWEIIFWDNQSTDKSAEIVKSYDDKRIKYFYAHSFELLYGARNFAIEKAIGEYISFLDCDDTWNNKKLEKQVNLMCEREYTFCYSNFYFVYGNKLKKASIKEQPSGDIFKYQISNYSIGILTVMLKKEAWDAMEEKFDKNFNYPGDFDFFIRFLFKNKAIYINEPLAFYRADNINSISNTKKLENLFQQRMAVEKLEKLFIDNDNKKEFDLVKAKLILQESGYYFRNKDFIKSRVIINNVKFFNKKTFILYILTFLPNFVLNYIAKRV